MMRIIYAILTAVFAMSATMMLAYRPGEIWGRLYVVIAAVMLLLCIDATIRSRNSLRKKDEGTKADDAAQADDPDRGDDDGAGRHDTGGNDDGGDADGGRHGMTSDIPHA